MDLKSLIQKFAFIFFIENPLKMMENDFYFMLKAFFALEIFPFLSWLFVFVEKRIDKKIKGSFKIYEITDWTTNIYTTYIVQYLNK